MIFSEFQLGPHTLKNRLIALPVFTGYALPDGQASDMLVDHYAHLAGTGVALVVVANAAVAVDGMASTYNLRADSPRFLPGLKRLARAIRMGGALDSAHLAFNIASLKEFMNFFVLEQGFNCSRWPRWLQERTDLEHKLLGRGMFKGVWVVANVEDIEILRASMPLMVPARHGISATILFLITEKNILALEPVMDEVMAWGRERWKR